MAKPLLITVIVILTAFTINEVIGASRYRRGTTGNLSGDLGPLQFDAALNVTQGLPSLNETVQQLRNSLKNISSPLLSQLNKILNNTTVSFVDKLNRALILLRNSTTGQLQNTTGQLLTALNNSREALTTYLANTRREAQQYVNQTIANLTQTVQNTTGLLRVIGQQLLNSFKDNYNQMVEYVNYLMATTPGRLDQVQAYLDRLSKPLRTALEGLDHVNIGAGFNFDADIGR